MTTAVYRSDDDEEIVLSRVPSRFYIPDILTLADKDTSVQFRYVGDGRCEAKIAHGPGHQSTARCQALGTHDVHYVDGLGASNSYAEWTDSDITAQGVAFA